MEVTNTPLLGTQISMMVFPLIPSGIKLQLPNKSEVEFVHAHSLGDFNFLVQKSPAGFNVTIRPLLSQPKTSAPEETFSKPETKEVSSPISSSSQTNSLSNPGSEIPLEKFDFSETAENFSSAEVFVEPVQSFGETETEICSLPQIEVVQTNDPEFQTFFSDASTYEPPLKKSEFAPMPELYSEFQTEFLPQNNFQPEIAENNQIIEPIQFTQTVQMPVSLPQIETAFVSANSNPQMKSEMDGFFIKMAEIGASDLHLSVSMPPMIRMDGKIKPLENGADTLSPEKMKALLTSIIPAKNQEEFANRRDTDFAYEIPNLARFRANIFMDRKGMGGVFRIIPTKILTAEQLGLSPAIMKLCDLSKGLVVVTGPTGSGKSTTLCAMIDHINKTREDHIITIEDPIEFVHDNQKCLINQREVHNHTDSFKDALRAALREDPDIVLVGEMRDLETISIAIETAETGHLVFGTLHTTTAVSTVDRIIDQFPADRQQQIRVMLSESLKGVIAQTLLPKKGGGRVAALEVLIVTPAISNLIREGKTFQIASAMQTGKANGMVMLNDALFNLVQKGMVEPKDAYIKAVDKPSFETLLQRNNIKI